MKKAVAWLCDTTKWTKYVDNTKANWAIGSPSADFYCASYNDTHKSSIEGVDYLTAFYQNINTNGYGYKVNGKIQNSGYWTNSNVLDITEYESMYCKSGSYWWWLASPSFNNAADVCAVYGSRAGLDCCGYNGTISVCPLVSLKSDAQLKLK